MGIFGSKDDTHETARKYPVDQSSEMTALDRAKLDVRMGKNRLTKWSKHLEKEMDRLQMTAKELLKANKREKAMMVLKLRKLKTASLQSTQNQLLNLEKLLVQIETEEMTIETIGAIKKGTEALKITQSIMSLENVENLMEENDEALAKVQEISDALSSADTDLGVDEDELQGELESMMLDMGHLNVTPSMFPVAPVGPIATENEELHEGGSERRVLMSS